MVFTGTEHNIHEQSFSDKTAEIKEYIESNLKEKRIIHTYSVVDEAVRLAQRYGEDVEKAAFAALCHDMCRGMSTAVLNMYIRQLGLPQILIDKPNLSHGKVAAEILKKDYGIADEDILNAVSYHTTGRKDMSDFEKIIFLADAIEPGRTYPTVEETRALAYDNLDRACINSLERTIEYINGTGNYLDPDTIKARDDLKEKLKL